MLDAPARTEQRDRLLGGVVARELAAERGVGASQLGPAPRDAGGAPRAEGHVGADRVAEQESLAVAVLGHERNTGCERRANRARSQRRSADLHAATHGAACARERLEE